MWNQSRNLETIDASEKALTTVSDSVESRPQFEVLVEGLTGLPEDTSDCRLLFQQGNEVFKTSFCSVDHNGIAVIDEAFLVHTPRDQTSNVCQECQFVLQSRDWLCQEHNVKTLGQMKVDGESLFANEDQEETVSLDGDSIELEGGYCVHIHATVSRLNKDTEDDGIFAFHNFNAQDYNSDDNHVPETEETVLISSYSSADSVEEQTTTLSENKHRRGIDDDLLFRNYRRAHYASNWIKANRIFRESYDNLGKPVSMENARSFEEDSLRRSLSQVVNDTGLEISNSSSDFEVVYEDLEEQHQTLPDSITLTGEASRQIPDSNSCKDIKGGSVFCKQLEEENLNLRLSVSQLQQELEQSRNETTRANARISSLVSDLASANRQISDHLSQSVLNKQHPSSSSQNNTRIGLSRQQSTLSEYLEDTSKKSLVSNVNSGTAPSRSSLKSITSRTGSIPAVNHTELDTQFLSKTDAFEVERLAFAEKLFEKEEIIAKLQTQMDFSTSHLRQLEAGIEDLETRFNSEINIFKAETTRQYKRMLERGAELISASSTSEKGLEDLKQDLQDLAENLQTEVKKLELEVSLKIAQNDEMEEREDTLFAEIASKDQMLTEAETKSNQLMQELEQMKLQNEEKTKRVQNLETLLAQLEKELVELRSTEKPKVDDCEDVQVLHERINGLEHGLAEYESRNRELLKQLELTQKKLAILDDDDLEQQEFLNKENQSLRLEISDLTEKLTEYEQEITSLKKAAQDQIDAVAERALLSEKVKSLQKANQELEFHLSRRKKHIEGLQGDLKELKLKVIHQETDQGFESYVSNDTVPSQVDAVIQAERRYSDLEQILAAVQEERDKLMHESTSKGSALRKLMKENQALSDSNKQQHKENSRLKEKLSAAKTEISELRSGIKSAQSSRNANNGIARTDHNIDVMQELVSAKVALAEMDEALIKARRELHASSMKNIVLTGKLANLKSFHQKPKPKITRRRFILRRKPSQLSL